jgi:hypothetical protein
LCFIGGVLLFTNSIARLSYKELSYKELSYKELSCKEERKSGIESGGCRRCAGENGLQQVGNLNLCLCSD